MTTLSLLLAAAATLDVSPDSLDSRRGYVLEFSATWCGPCQKVGPIVARLERSGYPIRKVDIEREPQLARKYQVRSIPSFILVVDGKEKNRIVGATSESEILRMLAQVPRRAPANAATLNDRKNGSAPTGLSGSPTVRGNIDSDSKLDAKPDRTGPLAASVRIRVQDSSGTNFGSGTIFRSAPGRSLILTCGHILRGLGTDATIEVDFFAANGPETFVAEVVEADQQADLGILAIRTSDRLPTARIETIGVQLEQQVISIGCGGGNEPSVQTLQVTALNRYLGPDNVECSGVPVQGRSGGGLFNRNGGLVGVCIAADPQEKRGLYSGLKPIQHLLQSFEAPQNEIAKVPANRSVKPIEASGISNDAEILASERPGMLEGDGGRNKQFAEQTIAAVEEDLSDAEVICIIRSRKPGQAGSRVVIINKASGKFVRYLTSEMRQTPSTRSAMKPNRDERLIQGASGAGLAGLDVDRPTSLLPAEYRVQYSRFRRENSLKTLNNGSQNE